MNLYEHERWKANHQDKTWKRDMENTKLAKSKDSQNQEKLSQIEKEDSVNVKVTGRKH